MISCQFWDNVCQHCQKRYISSARRTSWSDGCVHYQCCDRPHLVLAASESVMLFDILFILSFLYLFISRNSLKSINLVWSVQIGKSFYLMDCISVFSVRKFDDIIQFNFVREMQNGCSVSWKPDPRFTQQSMASSCQLCYCASDNIYKTSVEKSMTPVGSRDVSFFPRNKGKDTILD